MEMVLDRCIKTKPDLVLLPLTGRKLSNVPTLLNDRESIDEFLETEVLYNNNIYKEGKAERAIYERVNSLKKINTIMSTLY